MVQISGWDFQPKKNWVFVWSEHLSSATGWSSMRLRHTKEKQIQTLLTLKILKLKVTQREIIFWRNFLRETTGEMTNYGISPFLVDWPLEQEWWSSKCCRGHSHQISARWRRSCLKDFARENRCVGIMYCWSFWDDVTHSIRKWRRRSFEKNCSKH